MSKTPERKVKDEVIDMLDAVGAVWCAPIGSVFGKSDQLDFIACVNGRYLEIETKATPNDKATSLQLAKMREVEAVGGTAVLIHCDNLPELGRALAYLTGLLEADVIELVAQHKERNREKKRNRGKRVIHLKED